MSGDPSSTSLQLLYNVSRELTSTLDLRTVLERVLFLSVNNVGAERGSLIVLDHDRQPLDAAIVYAGTLHTHELQRLQSTLESGLAGWVMRSGQPALVEDTSQDERWTRREDDDSRHSGSKSAVCLPLTARDELVGVLTIVHPVPGFFTQDHLALLEAIGAQAGIAIHNARLYDSLGAAHRRYHELFDDNIDPILITDLNGQILEANRKAAQVIGLSTDALTQKSVLELLPADAGQPREEMTGYESSLLLQNGSTLPVEVYTRQVKIEDEAALQWILRDISERKLVDTLREDLAAMIYHDLRSPLANIVSSLDMLEALIPTDQDPSLRTVLSIATHSTERMQRLISSLLDINRLEAGQSITNQNATAVPQLLHEVVVAVQPMLDGKQQALSLQITDGLPAMWVDADMIRRVLINLVENATKFTPVKGAIRLQAEMDGEAVRLVVSDTGPGIPPEKREQIFEKFARLQADRFPKGLGLGLAFCRLAVQAHGGKIWVENNAEGGARFCLTLPVKPNQVDPS